MKGRRLYLFFLAVFRASRSISAGMITLAFPYLVLTTLHRSPLTLGLLYTMAAVATAGFGLLFGFLADIWGQKKTLVVVALMLPASSMLVFISGHIWVLFLATAIGGYSATGSLMGGGVGGAAQPIQMVVLTSLTSLDERTFYFSVFTFMSGGFAAVGALMARLFTVRDIFLAATLISAVGLAFLWPIRLEETRGEPRRLSSKRVIGKFTLTGALNGFSQGLITPFLIPFFVLVYGIPKSQMSVYGFISGTLGAVSILAAPRLERHFGFVKSIAFTRGLGALLLLLLPVSHYLGLALAIYFLTPALRVAALPIQQNAMVVMVDQNEVGRALGINQVARLAASAGAISLTGYLFDISDIGLPFYVYAGVMAVNIYLYFHFFSDVEESASA
ncbi:MAG TPA: MFS transporter [Terriglobia bacterium]|nr:MFS transporter [Terriglobia bacterium]